MTFIKLPFCPYYHATRVFTPSSDSTLGVDGFPSALPRTLFGVVIIQWVDSSLCFYELGCTSGNALGAMSSKSYESNACLANHMGMVVSVYVCSTLK